MRVMLVAATEIVNDVPGYVTHYELDWIINSDGSFDVKLIDELAEEAGRLCYLSWDRPNPETATNKGYIANIIRQQHFSVLEHASATFYIDGVSRNFTHELIRHRHLSFSEVSQRYVDVSEFKFVGHPTLTEQHIDNNTHVDELKGIYSAVMDDLDEAGYKRKEARQAARAILPGGLETKILVTGNMRAWREVLQKRLSPTADKEFQLVAQKILEQLREIAPNTFQDFR